MKVFKKIGVAVKDSYNELVHKVSWPTWSELTNSAVVVMIASVIIALFIFVVDTVFNEAMSFIYKLVI
ncbi:preprotein translocase subunit SecE [Falsiporphyromonas endometrii]|uniref:Protein translocase subunit SecE n=1 Tax=Falsiporphyromonas endometrii TaxID=1387297 RepID=A0ABV9K918_9PORP